MADKKFLMLSLEDEATRKVANVVSNDSCKKILDYLSEKEATESEIAEKLILPLSTVHYNLKQLVDVGLVSADEFHYSKKGKEILHYKLANKYIIITPKAVRGIKDKLRAILPVASIAAGAAGIAQLVNEYFSPGPMAGAAESASLYSANAPLAKSMAMQQSIPLPAESVASLPFDIALWFFAGAVVGVLIYLLLSSAGRER